MTVGAKESQVGLLAVREVAINVIDVKPQGHTHPDFRDAAEGAATRNAHFEKCAT